MEKINLVERKSAEKSRIRLGELLLKSGLITPNLLQKALERQQQYGKRLGETLLDLQMITEFDLAKGLAIQWDCPFLDLGKTWIDPKAVLAIHESLARQHRVMPVAIKNRIVTVAIEGPPDYEIARDLEFSSGFQVALAIATTRDILEAIDRYYSLCLSEQKILPESFQKIEKEDSCHNLPAITTRVEESRSLEERSQSAPVVQLVHLIISRAIKQRASDIHIEPGRYDFRIRYRVDGLLKDDLRLNSKAQAAVVSRIKVLARLDIAERRLPQDGAILFRFDQRDIDLRISTLPTLYGEKVVIRILDKERIVLSLDRLGFSKDDLVSIQSFLERKQGILLLTGPTGSGKTTTLYAMVQALKSEVKNIVTVEDPIEYHLEGIIQVQVYPQIGLTFAACLRAILRQDPNIILIGEIRDLETAEIAIRAAMTGHLVLSTLHTNDASAAISRLTDLGIPRYLVASTVIGVMAQRLIRLVCSRCKTAVPASTRDLEVLRAHGKSVEGLTLYHGEGCPYCGDVGYYGRSSLFEILDMTSNLRDQVCRGISEQDIRVAAQSGHKRSLWQDGLKKLQLGMTTVEELLRVLEMQ
jgi:type IV pilus assembly protein PilB